VARSPNGKRIARSRGSYGSYYTHADVVRFDKPSGAMRVVDEPGSWLSNFRWRGKRISYVASRPES
jgi:hypothetical protein